MNAAQKTGAVEISYRCPVCGNGLPHSVAAPPFEAPCSECGTYLWCRRKVGSGPVTLEAIPGRSPEPPEVERVVKSLVAENKLVEVVLDLSMLETVTSSFMARMIMMNRRIHAAGGSLSITGLQPLVHDLFHRARLDMALHIEGDDASASL